MKPHFTILAAVLLAACTAFAAVPLKWSVETSRTATQAFDAYHGETLALDASLLSYGQPLDLTGQTARLFYQTNGMDSAWWSVSATISATNHITATFAQSDDPGAKTLTCFLGVTGSVYRAAFRIRFLNSPGAKPNVLPLPSYSYDAELVGNPSINGTNLTTYVQRLVEQETDPFAPGLVSNIVSKTYVESLGIQAVGSDASAVKITDGVATNLTVISELRLGDSTVGTPGFLEFIGNDGTGFDGESSTTWWVGMPGWWAGIYRLRGLDTSKTNTVAFVSDVDSATNAIWSTCATRDFVASAVDGIPSTYAATNALAPVNCSVQTIVDPSGDALPQFQVPAAVSGGVRDWVVHVVSSGSTDITVAGFPATVDGGKTANFYAPSETVTNACTHGTITTFYFSEINSTAGAVNFMVNRAELTRISPTN